MSSETKDSSAANVQLLLTCWRHADAGKINYVAVAKDLDIVSGAAAHKRVERLLKAHGMKASGFARDIPAITPAGSSVPTTPVSGADGSSTKTSPKKKATPTAPRSTKAKGKRTPLPTARPEQPPTKKPKLESHVSEDAELDGKPTVEADLNIDTSEPDTEETPTFEEDEF